MEWFVAVSVIIALICIVFLYRAIKSGQYERRMSSTGEADQAAMEAVTPLERGPARLTAVLRADLRGRPGTFATKWEPQAAYQLYVEIADAGSGAKTTHALASGYLSYWHGGAGRTIHDAGYALPDQDFEVVKGTLLEFLRSLDADGWEVFQATYWVDQEMRPSEFGIQVRADHAYDTSPTPGIYHRSILSTDLTPADVTSARLER